MRCHNVASRELGQRNAQTDNRSVWLKGRWNNRSIAGKLSQHVPLAKAEHSIRFVYIPEYTTDSLCGGAYARNAFQLTVESCTHSSILLQQEYEHESVSHNSEMVFSIAAHDIFSIFFLNRAHHLWCWTFFGLFSALLLKSLYMLITRVVENGRLRRINKKFIESICPFCVENTRRHNLPAWHTRTPEMKYKLIELTRLKLNGKLTHTEPFSAT